MLRTSLLIGFILITITGFTLFTDSDPVVEPLPPSAIFFAKEGNPDWLQIKDGVEISAEELVARYRQHLGLGLGDELRLYRVDEDNIGFTHYRYQQYFNGIKVQGSQLLVHEKGGLVKTLNGKLTRRLNTDVNAKITREKAIENALKYMPSQRYMWENQGAEQMLKRIKRDPAATYYPQPELVLVDAAFSQKASEYRLAYSLEVYSFQPEAKKWMFVDAATGDVFHEINMLHEHNVPGTAETKYHGTREIIVDSIAADSFRLFETTRGHGIHTLNLMRSTNTDVAVDFFDDDNYWNNVNSDQDEAATDAHWGAEMTFDYFLEEHDFLGLDGDSMMLVSYVHYGDNVTNAFWNGAYASLGDGGASSTALTALDVVGHEFVHGITDFTADLVYQDESGALNESFSDIFGTAIEFWADPATGDWEIGEDFLVEPFRNMADPGLYNDPDTYFGDNWTTSSGDNGGVHTNSGVQNFWFFLLTEGKVDTNDFNNPYEVLPLGLDTAAQIAFRNLKYYLTESSRYSDARFGAVQAAADLFGNCSFEVQQTQNAWYAVGVGPQTPLLDIGVSNIVGVDEFRCEVSATETVTVKLVFSDCNADLEAGSKIPVFYQINNGMEIWDTVEIINSLVFGDTVTFTFAEPIADLIQPGIYTLTVGADFVGDNTPDNNVAEMVLERIYDQNVDLGVTDLPDPLPGCFLETKPLSVEIGFFGCDLIEGGQSLDVSYQLDDDPVVTENITIPFDLQRGERFVHTFAQEVDLSEIKNHRFDAWAGFPLDTLNNNDSLLAQFVVNPVLIQLEDFISFEAGMTSTDSFYYITGSENRAFISTDAARDGEFGFQVTGGDYSTAFFNNEVTYPTVTNVWDVNQQFHSNVCFCADLFGYEAADFKFRLKQTFSPLYKNDFGIGDNLSSAARVLVNGIQESSDFFPLGNTASPYFNWTVDLEEYLGTKVEICIETSLLLDVALDPYGVGDNAYIDNVTIVGTPNSTFSALLPDDAVNVFPNPGNGQYTVSIKNEIAIDGILKITDPLGRTVQENDLYLNAGENQMELQIDAELAGVYYLQIISQGKKVVKEIVLF
ncbi:MAG: M4 family metallopeptidase [Bacteroidota bacterium]